MKAVLAVLAVLAVFFVPLSPAVQAAQPDLSEHDRNILDCMVLAKAGGNSQLGRDAEFMASDPARLRMMREKILFAMDEIVRKYGSAAVDELVQVTFPHSCRVIGLDPAPVTRIAG